MFDLVPAWPATARPAMATAMATATGAKEHVGDTSRGVQMSRAHSMKTITASTRFGDGNRNAVKTIARRGIDVLKDLDDISKGKSVRMPNGDIKVPSGRIFGEHPGTNTVFLRSGSPGTVDLTQSEFSILTRMVKDGGLREGSKKMLDGLLRAKNKGVNSDTEGKLNDLFQ